MLETSSSLEPYRHRIEKQLIGEYMNEDVYTLLIRFEILFLSKQVLHTRIPKEYISIKMTLNNYDGLANPREHVQNIHNNIKLVIQDNYVMYNILPITFRGSVRAWCNNLESSSIISFDDLYT